MLLLHSAISKRVTKGKKKKHGCYITVLVYVRHLRKLILSMMGRLIKKNGEALFCDILLF